MLVLLTALVVFTQTASAQVIVDFFAVGPNTTSPSFPTWANNLGVALQTGATTVGDQSSPTGFHMRSGPWLAKEFTVSTVHFWDDFVPTGLVANEFGRRTLLAFDVVSPTKFTASQIGIAVQSSDPANSLGLNQRLTGFSASRVGIDYVDGIKGNGNDIVYTSGDHLVNEAYGVPPSVAYSANNPAGLQQVVDYANATHLFLTGTITLFDNGQNILATSVAIVPEPKDIGLVGALALVGFAGWRHRQKLRKFLPTA